MRALQKLSMSRFAILLLQRSMSVQELVDVGLDSKRSKQDSGTRSPDTRS